MSTLVVCSIISYKYWSFGCNRDNDGAAVWQCVEVYYLAIMQHRFNSLDAA